MKVKDTKAYKATWAHHILPLFSEWEVLEDNSDVEFWCSGKVDILIKTEENGDWPIEYKFGYAHISWEYGSCSVCDSFYEMNHLEIMKDLLNDVLYFEGEEELESWKKRRSVTNGKDEEDC